MLYEVKNISNSVLDVDDASRRVKVALSEMGSVDLDNDVMDQNAYTKTIAERGPKGKNLTWHLTDHSPNLKSAVGKFSQLYVDGNKLIGITNIPKTTWGNDVLEFYKTGHINQHSVGFQTMKVEKGKGKDYNLIKEVKLMEGSCVLWGANPNTPTIDVGKSVHENSQDFLMQIGKELESLQTSLKDGKFSDEGAEFIEIKILQLTTKLKYFWYETTQPQERTEPEPDKMEGRLKEINQLFSHN